MWSCQSVALTRSVRRLCCRPFHQWRDFSAKNTDHSSEVCMYLYLHATVPLKFKHFAFPSVRHFPRDCIPQPHNIRVPVQKRRLSRQKSERNIIDSSEESGGASAPHTHTKTLKLFLWKIIVTCYFKNKITIYIPCESLGHVNLRTIIAHDHFKKNFSAPVHQSEASSHKA